MTFTQVGLCNIPRAVALNLPENRPGHIDLLLFTSAYREFLSSDEQTVDIQLAAIVQVWRDRLMAEYLFTIARLTPGVPLVALCPPLNVRLN